MGVRNASGVLISSSGGIRGKSFQANGDLEGLPPAVAQCAFDGAGAEGTALLEIVHDLAPAAQLSFANPDTDLAFNQAVDFLAATNDIVLDDLGFFAESYDGTSTVSSNTARALNNPAFPIRGYFTSVGNAADEHYYGAYVDSHVDGRTMPGIVRPGNLHLFQQTADTTDVLGLGPQPYNVIALPRGGEVAIFLSWDDPAGGSGNNYDLYLVNETTGRAVAASIDVQRGAQDPIEFIDYVNPGASARFRIVVQNAGNAAQPKNLNLFSFQPECASDGPRTLAPPRHERHNFNTASRSVLAQSDAGGTPVSVVSVAAICSASATAASFFASAPNASCLDVTHSTVEFFSSRGPTVDGRQKPDVSAIDGVSVSGAGGFVTTFFGTSAAVPHVGAIAALALQAAPCLLDGGQGALDPVAARLALRNTDRQHRRPVERKRRAGQRVGLRPRRRHRGNPGNAAGLHGCDDARGRREQRVRRDADRRAARLRRCGAMRPDAAGLDRRLRDQSRRGAHLPARDEHGQRLGQPQRRQLLGADRPAHHGALKLQISECRFQIGDSESALQSAF